jgi:G3E family GTPase
VTLPITVVCGLDRSAALRAGQQLLGGDPSSRLLTHCLDQVQIGLVSRTTVSGDGQVDAALIDLDHGCVSCTLREDVLPALVRMSADPAVGRVVLVLPEAVEPIGFLECFRFVADGQGRTTADACHVDGVVAVLDPVELIPALSNHELLSDRGLHVGDGDDRGFGDVVVAQLECADLVLAPGASPQERSLLRLLNADAAVLDRLPDRVQPVFDFDRTWSRTSPAVVDHFGSDCLADDAWLMHWRSVRPLHPTRLHDVLDEIAEVALRGRGHFRVATRPGTPVEWDSVGSRLRLGAPDAGISTPSAHLSFVGVSDRRSAILDALDSAVLTDAEMAAPATSWRSVDDPFLDVWLDALDIPDFPDLQEDS